MAQILDRFPSIKELPWEQRRQLAHEIMETHDAEASEPVEIPSEHRRELEARFAEIDAAPNDGFTQWKSVRDRIRGDR